MEANAAAVNRQRRLGLVLPAHALLQTLEDVEQAVQGLPVEQLWATPGGAASIGFHLIHLSGSTDRLLTYARGLALNDAQKAAIGREKNPARSEAAPLIEEFRHTVDAALAQIRATPASSLGDAQRIVRQLSDDSSG